MDGKILRENRSIIDCQVVWNGSINFMGKLLNNRLLIQDNKNHDLNIGEGFTEFERYDTVLNVIEENSGVLDEDKAIDLLAEIGVMDGETDKLQWSVLYNLTTGDGQIFANRIIDNIIYFHLDMEK